MSPSQLLIEVLRVSRQVSTQLEEVKKTQKKVGLLLNKLGQNVTQGAQPRGSARTACLALFFGTHLYKG